MQQAIRIGSLREKIELARMRHSNKSYFHCKGKIQAERDTPVKMVEWSSRCHIEFHLGIHFHVQMTFFVFLVGRNIAFFRQPFLPFRVWWSSSPLSSGKMKFLVQFAIRCECKRPLPLLDIEKKKKKGRRKYSGETKRERNRQRAKYIAKSTVSMCDALAIAGSPTHKHDFFSVLFAGSLRQSLYETRYLESVIKSNLSRSWPVLSTLRVISHGFLHTSYRTRCG